MWREQMIPPNPWGKMSSKPTQSTSDQSRRSTVFSINQDLTEIDRNLRLNLEQHFRPVFQRFVYGGEKIASHDLKRLLEDDFYRDMLPPEKVSDLNDLVDFNPGKAISYTEFVRIVLGEFQTDLDPVGGDAHSAIPKKTCFNELCRNVVPQIEVDDYLASYRWIPPPFFMIAISVAELIAFIYYAADIAKKGGQVEALDIVPAYSELMYLQNKRQECWRFVSYFLLHQGAVDLVFNILLQILVGFPVEIIFRWWRMASVYILGIITGSLLQSISDHQIGLAGAAGGCYAVVIGHVMGMIYNWSELNRKDATEKLAKHFWLRPWFRLLVIFILVAIQTSLAIYRRFYTGAVVYRVGIGAHAGGILAGIVLGKTFLTDNLRYPWQKNSGWLDLFTILIFFGACVIFNILYKGYPPEE